jgi:uncharacterized membrane protein
MPEAILTVRTIAERAADVTLRLGPAVFSLAFAALGIETLMYARVSSHALGPQYNVIPVIPWLPAIPLVAYAFGGILVLCAAGLLLRRIARTAGMTLGGLLFLCTLGLEVPKYAVDPSSMSLRTGVFEPLALACLAWLALGLGVTPNWFARTSRYLLALSLIVFGVDHFLALAPIASLIPVWIPWRVFWVAFFGAAFIASGLSIAFNWLLRAGAAGLGTMFAIWVLTLHVPRVLGLYGIPGAPTNPNEWSSLFIAIGLWGGLWGLARAGSR